MERLEKRGIDLEIEVKEEGCTNEDKDEVRRRERQGWRWRLGERGGQQDGERQAWRQRDTDEHGHGLQPGL